MSLLSHPADFIVHVLFLIPALLLGFVLHEMAHAYVAVSQGDQTPRVDGRLNPDPRRHLDPFGLILVLLMNVGYARPVRINPSRLRGDLSRLMVALAGPAANLLIAALASVPIKLLANSTSLGLAYVFAPCSLTQNPVGLLLTELFFIFTLNLLLMVFNLFPVPPLDGFEIIRTLLRTRNPRLLWQIESNSQNILLAVVLIVVVPPFFGFPSPLFLVINAVAGPIAGLLGVRLGFPC